MTFIDDLAYGIFLPPLSLSFVVIKNRGIPEARCNAQCLKKESNIFKIQFSVYWSKSSCLFYVAFQIIVNWKPHLTRLKSLSAFKTTREMTWMTKNLLLFHVPTISTFFLVQCKLFKDHFTWQFLLENFSIALAIWTDNLGEERKWFLELLLTTFWS